MKRWFPFSVLVFAAVIALSGCDIRLLGFEDNDSENPSTEVPVGTFASAFDSYVITASTITYTGFDGSVTAGNVVRVESGVNNDTALGDNVTEADTINAGHAVVQWTEPAEIAGAFNVFRWGDVPGTTDQKYMATWFDESDFTQGAFSSVGSALTGAQNETGSWFMGTYTEE